MSKDNQLFNLLESTIKYKPNIDEAKKSLVPKINIVNVLGNTYEEVPNSALLCSILNFKYGDVNFAKDFSEYIIEDEEYKDKIKNTNFENVYKEFQTNEGRRIDILIVFDTFEIIIENKINAGDQENQLEDYYNDRFNLNNGKKDIFIIYLTKNAYKPSEYSIDKGKRAELEENKRIYYLSHNDIAKWIEEHIFKKYKFLKEEKYQSVYSALIQIKNNEKIISKTTEEDNMEQEKIQELFEKHNYFELLKNSKLSKEDFDNLDECIRLFENATKVIQSKKVDIVSKNEKVIEEAKYSVEVSEHINGIPGTVKLKEENIKYSIQFGKSHNMQIVVRQGLSIRLEQNLFDTMKILIWLYPLNNNITKKLEEIEDEIKKVFNNFQRGKDSYIYFSNLDIKNNKAEDTAKKIIELYNILKKNIPK